jgi:hypothetical protein
MNVASLSNSEEGSRVVNIVNIKQAENIALSRDGNHFAVVGKGGINVYTDPDTIAFQIYCDFTARRAVFS